MHVHGRIDDFSLAAVNLLYASPDEARIGNEAVYSVSGSKIPLPDLVQQPLRYPALQPAVKPTLPQVLMLEIPGIANGRIDIADMKLVRPGQHALGDGVSAGEHHIVCGHIKLLYGQRH